MNHSGQEALIDPKWDNADPVADQPYRPNLEDFVQMGEDERWASFAQLAESSVPPREREYVSGASEQTVTAKGTDGAFLEDEAEKTDLHKKRYIQGAYSPNALRVQIDPNGQRIIRGVEGATKFRAASTDTDTAPEFSPESERWTRARKILTKARNLFSLSGLQSTQAEDADSIPSYNMPQSYADSTRPTPDSSRRQEWGSELDELRARNEALLNEQHNRAA